MDRVDDGRHPGATRGKAAENAGLSTMRVDEVRRTFAKQLCQIAESQQVVPRMDGANEMRADGEDARSASERVLKRAFRAASWSGDESDVQVRSVSKAED